VQKKKSRDRSSCFYFELQTFSLLYLFISMITLRDTKSKCDASDFNKLFSSDFNKFFSWSMTKRNGKGENPTMPDSDMSLPLFLDYGKGKFLCSAPDIHTSIGMPIGILLDSTAIPRTYIPDDYDPVKHASFSGCRCCGKVITWRNFCFLCKQGIKKWLMEHFKVVQDETVLENSIDHILSEHKLEKYPVKVQKWASQDKTPWAGFSCPSKGFIIPDCPIIDIPEDIVNQEELKVFLVSSLAKEGIFLFTDVQFTPKEFNQVQAHQLEAQSIGSRFVEKKVQSGQSELTYFDIAQKISLRGRMAVTENMKSKCWNDSCSFNATRHCSRCKSTKYCSEKCQRYDWKHHKVVCKFLSTKFDRVFFT
jgi:hypothetical protein